MLPLEPGQIHLWLADQDALFDSSQKSVWLNWLADDESTRYHRFLYDKHKHGFLLTRAVSRSILSHYTDKVKPADWQFTHNDFGKPQISAALLSQLPQPIFFNISHSANKLAMVVSRHHALGVDVESTDKSREILKIGHRHFSEQEYQALCQLPPERVNARFYDLWTLKEAYIKACGLGLAISLQHFSFDLTESGNIGISFVKERKDDPALWQFWRFAMESDYKLAMAVKSVEKISVENIVARQLNSLAEYKEFNLPISAS